MPWGWKRSRPAHSTRRGRLAPPSKALVVVIGALLLAAGVALGISHLGSRRAAPGPVVARSGFAAVRSSSSSSSSSSLSSPSNRAEPSTSTAPSTSTTVATTTTTVAVPTVALTANLDAILAGTNSCLVVTDGATPIYVHQPTAPLLPASTQKLLVAAAALHLLGPDYRFVTQVLAPGAPAAGRVSSLWLRGGGDALLASPEYIAFQASRPRVNGYPWTSLGALADAVVGAGITAVPGGIRGDDTRYDQVRFLPAWPASYRSDQEVGALSALPLNEGVQTWKPVSKLSTDPPLFGASELARLLTARSVHVGPTGADQAAPSGAVVVAHVDSVPLSQIVQAMLSASDNLIAELLVREIDRHSGGLGTTAGGVAIVMQQATAFGVPTTGAVMQDGSGLSRGDRATCSELLSALDLGAEPGFAPISAGLAVAGQTGTLAARYIGTPFAGKLRAKTGSLDDAGGMVGILDLTRPLHFALLVNQAVNDTLLFAKEDAVVAALGSYQSPSQ